MKRVKAVILSGLMIISFWANATATVFAASAMQNQPQRDIKNLEQEIDAYIEMCKKGTASVSLAVFNHDETIYQNYYGSANIEDDILADEDTVYEWGSVTKLFVWVSVMQLYEQGEIDLNEDIQNYLPDDFLTKLKYDEPITMLHLMNHTAGFQETLYNDAVERTDASLFVSLEQSLRQSQPTQIYRPGEVCSYSNWGTALAAYIVEEISGQSFDQYVGEHIFSVLGMEHTAILPDWSDNLWVQEQRKKLNCYAIYEDSFESYGQNISHVFLYPIGAAAGTLEDFVKFAKAILPDENDKSLLFQDQATLMEWLEPTAYYSGTDIARNCHGLWTLPYGNGVIGHSGNTVGCSSGFYFDPITETGVVIMTNEVNETAYNYGLLSVIFGEYQVESAIESAIDADISGVYSSSRAAFKKGFMRVFQYIGGFVAFSATDDPDTYKMPLGQGGLTRVSDQVFMMDNGNGVKTLMVRATAPTGAVILETMSQDMIRENTPLFILRVALFLSFWIAVLYAAVMIGINGIVAAAKIIKKKKINRTGMNVFRIAAYCSMVATGISAYTLLFFDSGYIFYAETMQKCMLIVCFIAIPCVYTVLYLLKNNLSKKQKRSHAVTAFMVLCMLSNVIYWQWFNFWSF